MLFMLDGMVTGMYDVVLHGAQNKRSAKPPREEGAPQRVWGSVGGPLAGQEPMPGIASLSLEVWSPP